MYSIVLPLVLVFAQPATTQSRPSVESDLRRIIAGLQKQIVALKDENKRLSRELERAISEIGTLQDAAPKPLTEKFISVGMWRPDLERLIGSNGELVKTVVYDETFRWVLPNSKQVIPGPPPTSSSGRYELICTLRQNQVIAFQQTPIEAEPASQPSR